MPRNRTNFAGKRRQAACSGAEKKKQITSDARTNASGAVKKPAQSSQRPSQALRSPSILSQVESHPDSARTPSPSPAVLRRHKICLAGIEKLETKYNTMVEERDRLSQHLRELTKRYETLSADQGRKSEQLAQQDFWQRKVQEIQHIVADVPRALNPPTTSELEKVDISGSAPLPTTIPEGWDSTAGLEVLDAEMATNSENLAQFFTF